MEFLKQTRQRHEHERPSERLSHALAFARLERHELEFSVDGPVFREESVGVENVRIRKVRRVRVHRAHVKEDDAALKSTIYPSFVQQSLLEG